ncbi:MAG TPA: tetratricopeptide repeat protein [Thermoanaerobaculia bacterium]|nr:tetratricopeptide repeat protein [Thermoanaerobaculia bacterium]
MRAYRAMLMPLALALFGAAPVLAQAWAGHARLQGKISAPDGKPVEGAKIILRQGAIDNLDPANPGPGPDPILTDKKGRWSVLGLAGGDWTIVIVKEGYLTSQGTAKASEFGPAAPINVTLKEIPREVIEQAQKEAAASSAAGQARAALEKGNALLGEARAGGGNAKLEEARASYMEGLAQLDKTEAKDAAAQEAIAQTRLSVLTTVAGIDAELGHTDQALTDLKKVLEQKPDDAGVLQLVIDLLVRAGREKEAQQYIARLPAGTKLDPNAYLNMGIKAFNEGDMDKAFDSFDKAVKDNPELADGYYYRGLVWMNRGKKAEAKADLEKFLQLAPDHRYAADAKEFLKSL